MIFDESDIDAKFDAVAKFFATEDYIEPAPLYTQGPNWTDELREKHGWEKQPDGSWGRLMTSITVYNALKDDVIKLYRMYNELSKQNNALRKINNQLEYGCRVAALQIDKISKIDGDDE